MAVERPPKPYDAFPLFPHAKGYWAKKIAGRQVSFGRWAWPDRAAYEKSWKDAIDRYHQHQKDEAYGLMVVDRPELMTIADLVKAYLVHQHGRAVGENPEILEATYCEIKGFVEEFRDAVGAERTIKELEAFNPLEPKKSPVAVYLADVKSRYGWHSFNKRMTTLSGMWNWAEDPAFGPLRRPFRLRSFFAKRAEKLKRREKRLKAKERGKQLFTPDELRAFFDLAPLPMRAMIGLAYFGAFGNSDCSDLPRDVINDCQKHRLPDGWSVLFWVRHKTEIERGEAMPDFVLNDVLASILIRPKPREKEFSDRVFLTAWGNPWVRTAVHYDENDQIESSVDIDPLGQAFVKFRNSLGRCVEHGWFKRPQRGSGFRSDRKGVPAVERRATDMGLCPECGGKLTPMRRLPFYTLRHTALTFAAGAGADDAAVALFEGHLIGGIRREYIEEIEAHRLLQIGKRLLEKLSPIESRSVFRDWTETHLAASGTAAA